MSALRRLHARLRHGAERGQAMLEMALILPVMLLIVLGTLEFGFVMDHKLTLEYASREAARVGSALANGGGVPAVCNTIDNEVIAAAQRILESSDSNIDIGAVSQIRIYRADLGPGPDGREDVGSDPVNVWINDPGNGPVVDGVNLDFSPSTAGWDACGRINTGVSPESIGVSVTYTYVSRTPLQALMNLLQIGMYDFTVFELNPTNN